MEVYYNSFMIYLAFIILTLLILWLAFYKWQYFMVFTPTYHREGPLCEGCTLLSMRMQDGVELEGVLYEPELPRSTLLFFAGRSHDVVGVIKKLSLAYPSSRVVAFNYRSYGKSEGSVNEQNIKSDALHITKIVEKNYGEISLLGYSLGSSVAAFVASELEVKSLFLVGAFDSIASLAKSKFVDRGVFPYIDLSNIFRYKFRTGEYMKLVKAPSHLFVSADDEMTYISNARELRSKINNLTSYTELEGLSHKEILWDERVIQKINKELQKKADS